MFEYLRTKPVNYRRQNTREKGKKARRLELRAQVEQFLQIIKKRKTVNLSSNRYYEKELLDTHVVALPVLYNEFLLFHKGSTVAQNTFAHELRALGHQGHTRTIYTKISGMAKRQTVRFYVIECFLQ